MGEKGKHKDKGKAKSAPKKAKKGGLRPHEQRESAAKLDAPRPS
jgi:hypothetical protein